MAATQPRILLGNLKALRFADISPRQSYSIDPFGTDSSFMG